MGGISSRGQLVTQIDRRSGIHPLCSSVTTGQDERDGIKETTPTTDGDLPKAILLLPSVRLGMLLVTQVAKRGNLRALMSGRDNPLLRLAACSKMQPVMQKYRLPLNCFIV